MKKIFSIIALVGVLMCGVSASVIAQQGAVQDAADQVEQTADDVADAVGDAADQVGDAMDDAADAAGEAMDDAADAAGEAMDDAADAAGEAVDDAADAAEDAVADLSTESSEEVSGFHQEVKRLFIEGGANFMAFVLICLIFGLALAIKRIIYLNMATTNTSKLLSKIEGALNSGGVNAAKEVCRNTRGPVASIFYQGLDRSTGDLNDIAKAIEDYGSVEMSKLERGLSWISLFIALAPMLGFMGTVIGMISAFDKIEGANTINASIVAGGIKVALITTVSGLIVAIILQIFYNYILSKIDSIVLDMEEASMDLIDLLYKRQLSNNG